MNRDEFDSLVHQLESRYLHRAAPLRRWVVLWVIAGYAALLAWLVPLLLIGGMFLFGWASILPAPGVWIVVGAVIFALGIIQTALLVSIRIEPPKGITVTRQSAPGLFRELDRISDALRCRHFHRVCLGTDFGAAVWRVPRLGLFGWSQLSLQIGWPLLASLSPDEARAVLAHEFGHLSQQHGRIGRWLYGLHQMWGRVLGQLLSGHQSATIRKLLGAVIWCLNWFWPRLDARMFVLSRVAEYEADRVASEIVGGEHLASSLWRINCLNYSLRDHFTPEMLKLTAQQPEPPSDVLRRMHSSLARVPSPENAHRWMSEVEHALTDQADTHPSFSDRVRALGLEPAGIRGLGFPIVPPRLAASTAFFGSDAARFEEELSLHWMEEVRSDWRRQHGRAATLNRRLGDLVEPVRTAGEATPVEAEELTTTAIVEAEPTAAVVDARVLWERARVVADVEGLPAAEPVLRQLLSTQPTHVHASLMLGQHLLERDPQEGIELLRRVITSDRDDVIPQAGALLADYFRRTGSQGELQTIRRHMAAFEKEAEAARKERSSVTASDTFELHDLSRRELETLLVLLKSREELRRAWLVQKSLRHFSHRRLFVLCVEAERSGWWGGAERSQALATALIPQVRLPGQTLVIASAGGFASLARKIRRVPESLIYDAG